MGSVVTTYSVDVEHVFHRTSTLSESFSCLAYFNAAYFDTDQAKRQYLLIVDGYLFAVEGSNEGAVFFPLRPAKKEGSFQYTSPVFCPKHSEVGADNLSVELSTAAVDRLRDPERCKFGNAVDLRSSTATVMATVKLNPDATCPESNQPVSKTAVSFPNEISKRLFWNFQIAHLQSILRRDSYEETFVFPSLGAMTNRRDTEATMGEKQFTCYAVLDEFERVAGQSMDNYSEQQDKRSFVSLVIADGRPSIVFSRAADDYIVLGCVEVKIRTGRTSLASVVVSLRAACNRDYAQNQGLYDSKTFPEMIVVGGADDAGKLEVRLAPGVMDAMTKGEFCRGYSDATFYEDKGQKAVAFALLTSAVRPDALVKHPFMYKLFTPALREQSFVLVEQKMTEEELQKEQAKLARLQTEMRSSHSGQRSPVLYMCELEGIMLHMRFLDVPAGVPPGLIPDDKLCGRPAVSCWDQVYIRKKENPVVEDAVHQEYLKTEKETPTIQEAEEEEPVPRVIGKRTSDTVPAHGLLSFFGSLGRKGEDVPKYVAVESPTKGVELKSTKSSKPTSKSRSTKKDFQFKCKL